MEDPMTPMDQLGKTVARVQDGVIERRHGTREDLDEMREGLFGDGAEQKTPIPRRTRAPRIYLIAGFATAAAIAVGFSLFLLKGNPTASDPKALDGTWVSAPSDSSKEITFPDGSTIVLSPGAGARIISRAPAEGHVLIEYGAADIDIQHRHNTKWRVDVGPYKIRITGTSFHASWSPDDKEFSLSLVEGEVSVRGPLVRNWQNVSTGESFKAWIDESRVEFSGAGLRNNPPETPESESPDEDTATSGVEPNKSDWQPQLNWRNLNREGRFNEVYEEAEKMGWSRAQQTARSADLLALGDACRFLGKQDLAEATYLRVRKRFNKSNAASTAAFALGKVAFDQNRDYREAAVWLESYLKEQPHGPLAKEALGRVMEAHERSNNHEKARKSAAEYLSKFPGGPHALVAKRLLGQS